MDNAIDLPSGNSNSDSTHSDCQATLWQQTRINLASRALGGDVLSCSDDFFAEKDNLLLASEPVFLPEKFTAYGKWMDGCRTFYYTLGVTVL